MPANPEIRKLARESGTATIEQVGVILLLAVAFAIMVAIYLTGPGDQTGRGLGNRIANRIACGPREPGVCRQHPAVSAYGWEVARALRMLAPEPAARPGPGGLALGPVDFRYCQRPGCAVPGREGLTTANRRLTLFTEVKRLSGERGWEFTYWFYRPSQGWEAVRRQAGPAEIDAAAGTRVLLKDNPRLVPLEILPGRNHYRLPAGDEPPWRWQVPSIRRGWSA